MKKVSLIVPCYNEEQALPIFARNLIWWCRDFQDMNLKL